MDEDLKAINSNNPIEALMNNVIAIGKSLEVNPDEFDDSGWRNPLFSMTIAVARKNRAKDWFTGIELSKHVVGQDHEIQVHQSLRRLLTKKHFFAAILTQPTNGL